ncbi:MAG: hypothetical protein QM820_64905 [Minicystis sp.]
MLLLLRQSPDQAWSVEEVNRALKSSESSIRVRLAILVKDGILAAQIEEGHERYRYQPANQAMTAVIDGLAAAYRERRLAVIDLIYAKPGIDVVHFSEAFKVKRPKGTE